MNRASVMLLAGLLCPAGASGTTVVAARTADRIVISADGMRHAVMERGPMQSWPACKIRLFGDIVLSGGGLAFHNGLTPAGSFRVDDVARAHLAGVGTAASRVTAFENALRERLPGLLREMKVSDRETYDLLTHASIMQLILAYVDSRGPVMATIDFNAETGANESVAVAMRLRECPGFRCTISQFPSLTGVGQTDAIRDEVLHSNKTLTSDNTPGRLEKWVQTEVAADPTRVGPPISTLILDRSGPHWYMGHNGACPADLK